MAKKVIKITRWYLPMVTLGIITVPGTNFIAFSLELPWNNNQTGISCIPEGTYPAFKRYSQKNKWVYQLKDTGPRTYIQIHSANFTRSIEGCIAVGDSIKFLDNDAVPDVTNSKNTLQNLFNLLDHNIEIQIESSNIYSNNIRTFCGR